MAAFDLEEQEQLEELKTWWKLRGNLVTGVVTALAIAVVGWQGWNWYQRNQSAQASGIYGGLQQAVAQRDAKHSRELAGELIDKFSGTAYAGLGAVMSARLQVETGDVKTAQVQLGWAAENAQDPAVRDLARLRLAALLLDQKSFDDALKQLAAEPQASLAPRFAETRGDVLMAQGKAAEAKAAYEAAVAKLEAQDADGSKGRARGPYRDLLQSKIDMLAGAH
jgi:predicted negative regulator of RcsB-dependent stress response